MRVALAAIALSFTAAAANAVGWQTSTVPADEPPTVRSPAATTLWYRCYLKVSHRLVTPAGDERDLWRSSMVLALADLPGPIEVFANGQSIARHPGLAVGEEKRFKVPPDILQKDTYNALVIRVEGIAERGMTVAPQFLDYFNEVVIDGAWGLAFEKPEASEFTPTPERSPLHSHDPSDFRLSSRPLASTAPPPTPPDRRPGRRGQKSNFLAILPTDSTVGEIHYWVSGGAPGVAQWGFKTFDISFSTDGGSTFATTIAAATLGDFTQGSKIIPETTPVQSKTFTQQTGVDQIRLSNIVVFEPAGNRYGLSEMHFGEGAGPAAPFAITEIEYDPDADPNPTVTLTWRSSPGSTYGVYWSADMIDWSADLNDNVPAAGPGNTTSATFDLSLFVLQDATDLFFRVERN